MIDLNKKINEIKDKNDFIHFVELLANDLKANPDGWENKNLHSYLEAIASWTDDMEGFYNYRNLELPKDINWKVFANILIAAKVYE